jgi:hypothetical protein
LKSKKAALWPLRPKAGRSKPQAGMTLPRVAEVYKVPDRRSGTGRFRGEMAAHLLLESRLRTYLRTAGISWDKTSLHPTAARIQ